MVIMSYEFLLHLRIIIIYVIWTVTNLKCNIIVRQYLFGIA